MTAAFLFFLIKGLLWKKGRRWITATFLFFLIKEQLWLAAGTGLTLFAWNR